MRPRMVRIGDRRIETVGAPRSVFGDLCHVSITASWPRFIGAVVLITLCHQCAVCVSLPSRSGRHCQSLFHVIDEQSPLFGFGPAEMEAADIAFVLTITGHDETVAQPVWGRHNYARTRILFGHQFADILSNPDGGNLLVDYRKFRDVVPEAEPLTR